MKLHHRRIKPQGSSSSGTHTSDTPKTNNTSSGNLGVPPQQQNRSTSPSSNNGGNNYRKYLLMVHEKDFSDQEIIVNGKALTWLHLGDILEISQPKTPPSNEHNIGTTSSSPVSSSVINSVSTPIDISGNNNQNYSDLSFSPFSSYKSPAKISTPPTGTSFKQAPSVGNVTSTQQPQPSFTSSNNSNPKTFIVKVSSLDSPKGVPYLSISKNIADIFDFQSRREVYLRVIPKESAMLDYVVFSIRDHFLSRSDMWRFGLYLNDTSVYESKTLTWHGGIRVQVKELMKESTGKVSSGLIVYGHTKITYRSNSAVIYWLFQMSREMWEYDEYGNLIFERVINGFIKTVFDRWREVGVNHSLSIVFFSRHFVIDEYKEENFEEGLHDEEDHMASLGNRTGISHSIIGSKDGKRYVDFYKVVDCTETQRIRSQEIRILLKNEFLQFESMVKGVSQRERMGLQNSSAAESNFMEAINLVLNSLDKYYINRDLTRTGQVILLVSPGSGMFDVQIPVLGKITTKRLMDVGLSVDLIAHSVPPLHSVPIFRYKKKEVGVSNSQESPHLKEYTYYRSPDWINITFYRENYFKNDICIDHEDCECTDTASSLFLPVSKMPNLDTLPTNIPLFEKYWMNFNAINTNTHHTNSSGSVSELCRQHDDQVFKIFHYSRHMTQYQTSLSNIPHMGKKTGISSYDLSHGTPTKQKDERSTITDSSPKNTHHIINHHLEELKHSEQISGIPSSGSSIGFESSFDNNQQSELNGTTTNNTSSQHGGSHSSHHHLPITHNSATSMVNMSSANSGVFRRSPHSGAPFMAELAERHKAKELFYMKLFNPFHMDSETLSSPGSLQSNNQQNTFHRKRWGHLHPSSGLRPTQKAEYIKHFLLNVNWQGVSEPACLPITTDYWPESALKILNDFDLHTHTITDTNNIYNNISTLVRELVCQRLHQSFQLFNNDLPKDPLSNQPIIFASATTHDEIDSSSLIDHTEKTDTSTSNIEADNISTISSNSELSSTSQSKRGRGRALRGGRLVNNSSVRKRPTTNNSSNTTSETTITHDSNTTSKQHKVKPQKMEYCLSSANQFHRITYNPNISNMVTIDRYVPKVAKNAEKSTITTGGNSTNNTTTLVNDADPFNNARSTYTYRYMLWNPTLKSYESRITRFNSAVDYNWNKLDYLICGDHNQMTDELHNRSLQFHIVPINNSNKNLFASQTQLFGAFNNNSSIQTIGGSNSNSSSDLFSQSSSNSSNEYTKRLENFKKFKDTIVNRTFKGMDGDSIDVLLIGDENSNSPILPQSPATKTAKLQFVPQEGGIDDNSRVEWLNIVYKASYHPAEFWSLKVQWLVCTAALIDEFLQALARRARQLGFAMIQTPAEIDSYTNFVHASKQAADRLLHGNYKTGGIDPLVNVHPFRSYVRIPICSIEAMHSIRNAICEPPFNFLPDSFQRKNSKRFIHISGCIILHIDAIKGTDTALITWIDNPFQTFDLNVSNTVNQNEILKTLRKLVFSESSNKFTLQQEHFSTPGSNPFDNSQ